jgi:hypothetical protein
MDEDQHNRQKYGFRGIVITIQLEKVNLCRFFQLPAEARPFRLPGEASAE